ncbi:hypothetical protein D0Z70_20000 [Sphingobium terrigena]|uniref:Uncharacterized protein n=1 Tax=Sphingobium terrigena TaxID=2304063 RepID=A0A418YMW8_9SPHN|nr:hypothetical protein [Sphingobium terrigena]RJG52493.1 hypothetical protein D0Z70_20000 [Sphingobium terrigena]
MIDNTAGISSRPTSTGIKRVLMAPIDYFMQATAGPAAALFRCMLGLAWLGTAKGLINYFLSGRILDGWEWLFLLFLILLFTFAFIVVMVYAIEAAFDAQEGISSFRELVTRGAWIGIYLITFGVSVSFSFAFWWELLQAEEQTKSRTREDFELIQRAVTNADQRITSAKRSAMLTSAYFSDLSQKEEREGGSCSNPSGSSYGPITRMRAEEAQEAKGISERIDAFAQAANEQIAPALSAAKAAQAAGRYQDAQALLAQAASGADTSSDQLRGLVPEVRQRAIPFTAVGSEPGDSRAPGTEVLCLHAGSAQQYRRLADILQSLPRVGMPRQDVFTGARATTEAISRLLTPLRLTAVLPGAKPSPMQPGDFIPLVIALLVDLTLLIIGLMRGDKRRRGQRIDDIAAERARLTAAIEHQFQGDLNRLMIDYGGSLYFVVPGRLDAAEVERATILLFLRSFDRWFSPVVEYRLPRLFPFRLAMDAVARRRLHRRRTDEDKAADEPGMLNQAASPPPAGAIPWETGGDFHWFRFNRRFADTFLAYLGAYVDQAGGGDPFANPPETRREAYFARDRAEREIRDRERREAEAVRAAERDHRSRKSQIEREAQEHATEALAEMGEALSEAARALARAEMEARIAEIQQQTRREAARKRRADRGDRMPSPAKGEEECSNNKPTDDAATETSNAKDAQPFEPDESPRPTAANGSVPSDLFPEPEGEPPADEPERQPTAEPVASEASPSPKDADPDPSADSSRLVNGEQGPDSQPSRTERPQPGA